MKEFGKVIIGNKRKGAEPIDPSFLRIDVDRMHPILGNPYVLLDYTDDSERAYVIEQYRIDYEHDCATNGHRLEATKEIARKVYKGVSVALMCWCAGKPTYKPCHAEIIKAKIEKILEPYRK